MKKIPTMFARDRTTGLVLNEVTPGCEWVLNGEGVPTQKFDGTCCLIHQGALHKRYDAKHGKTPPKGWIAAQEKPDPVTGHWPGWLLIGYGQEDRWHRESYRDPMPDGTYELCGPRVQSNPEQLDSHMLIRHACVVLLDVPRTYDDLRQYLRTYNLEGIVWWHVDGHLAKIKARDYGLKRGVTPMRWETAGKVIEQPPPAIGAA